MAKPYVPVDMQSLFGVKGLVAVITGGGTGIGYLMARALAEAGAAKVYIVGRRVPVLQAAAASIGKPSVVPLYCDVTSKVSLKSIASVVETDAGYLNLLVCNSGVSGPQVAPPTEDTTLDEWRERQLAVDMDAYNDVFKINSTAVWYTAMAFLKLLDNGNKRGNVEQSSQVVVTSSIASFNKKAPGGWVYGQSKAAVNHIVKQLAVVLPKWDIRVNCIAPGLFPSEMSAPIIESFGGVPGEPLAIDKKLIPVGRIGDDQDMAGAMLFMASRAGGYMNGNIIIIDGGRLQTFPSTF